ncbi:ATP-binding cassette protein subfamily G, member 4, putative [Leishmania guyanensis]|uniref:ATP-binding cassette protein subfamily G, member 4, putative n=1 Tax=Leishmania guyanensis TaxID=5670 RepID=A0A1E1IS60_LEIGU|nr:ATP-binding cassette protein subfamily G, member 4, putative [Leishmania guyanensis]
MGKQVDQVYNPSARTLTPPLRETSEQVALRNTPVDTTDALAMPPLSESDGKDTKVPTCSRAVNFTWENLTYQVPVEDKDGNVTYKTLLFNLSGCAKGGRVLAIMGPSGAGKTTLMGTITGKLYNATARQEGCCFMNNNIYQQRYKRLVSYVCQDDIVMGKDTPREAIFFSARLRLGLDSSTARRRTADVIKRLSLTRCQDTILGIPGILKGVSGGERKRTNIGTELITNPFVMLLDEPTTGLDSVNAVRVGQLLQDLAKNDMRTVIATVHSPSSELFDLFDDLLLLAKGHVIYHGPTADSIEYFASLGYDVPPRTNPTEYFMNLLQLPEDILSQLWLAWEDYVMSDAARYNPCLTPVTGAITLTDDYLEEQLELKGASFCLQFSELFKRSWRMYLRDPGNFYGRSVQTLFFAIFLGLFFFNVQLNQQGVQDRQGALYMTLMNNLFGAAMNGIAAFPPERAVFLQEQANDAYNAYTYFLAKNAAELPWQILFPTLFDLIAYFLIHFHRSADAFFVHWFILVLLANLGYAFGLMFATFFKQSQAAFAMVPLILLPLFIVAGLFASTDRLYPYWVWLNYLSFPRHAYLGVFTNEFERLTVICSPVTPLCTFPDGQSVIEHMGFQNWRYWQSFIALIVYQIGLRFIGATSLFFQGRKRRGKLQFVKNLHHRVASPRAIASARSNDVLSDVQSTLVGSIATPSNAYGAETSLRDHQEPHHSLWGNEIELAALSPLDTPVTFEESPISVREKKHRY